jgi:hypothetical protein
LAAAVPMAQDRPDLQKTWDADIERIAEPTKAAYIEID